MDAEEYKDQIEQHELTKREGVRAWAEAVTEALPNMDPDKKILVREGLTALMSGPPRQEFPPPRLAIAQTPCNLFEATDPDGTITVYDWVSLSSLGTHMTRFPDGTVDIYRGDETVVSLEGEAGRKFWEWKTEMFKHVLANGGLI